MYKFKKKKSNWHSHGGTDFFPDMLCNMHLWTSKYQKVCVQDSWYVLIQHIIKECIEFQHNFFVSWVYGLR